MEAADSCINSPPSPPSTTSSPLWISSTIRIRGSASRPRRSLLSAHFSCEEAKTESPLSAEGLSKSLPSPPVSAFLDKLEEEALEPTTPPHAATFRVPPMAPRKPLKIRPPPRGKHKPRRLRFGEGGSTAAVDEREEAGPYSPRRYAARSINGVLTPAQHSLNSFAASSNPECDPLRRMSVRDLR